MTGVQTCALPILHSRCSVVDFALRADEKVKMQAQMFKRLTTILSTEGIEYDKGVLGKIVQRYFPDYRRTLNELQRYSTSGNIDAGVLSQVESVRKLDDLINYLKDKDFSSMRKWVVNNSDIDQSRIFRSIYDNLCVYLKPESVPMADVTLAKYQ